MSRKNPRPRPRWTVPVSHALLTAMKVGTGCGWRCAALLLVGAACQRAPAPGVDALELAHRPGDRPTHLGNGFGHPRVGRPLPLTYAEDLVGEVVPEWAIIRWDGGASTSLAALRGQVVVARFFTDTCPFCRATLPALTQLRAEFADAPVVFVGLYHAKPRGAQRQWFEVVQTARRWGADFPLGEDVDWRTLESWYGRHLRRAPTSVTFVIGKDGRFSFVHPGPVFHPSAEPDHARCDEDYAAVKAAVRRALR